MGTYFVEVTDTYGGESNYCWVLRFKVAARTVRGAISKVARETGYRFRSVGCDRYDARGACVCAFVAGFDPSHDELRGLRSI